MRWLRRVAEALARGHRAGEVVRATERDLDAMVADGAAEHIESPQLLKRLAEVRAYDRPALMASLDRARAARPLAAVLDEDIAPLVTAVGRAWVEGDLQVRHEHFVSEVLEDFLRVWRESLLPKADGAVIVLTTLPDEQHGLGLHMGALVCADAGASPRLLGTETPVDEIVRAAGETGAAAVAVSVSLATGGIETDRTLSTLRRQLPAQVRLVIGGQGARGVRRGPRGIDYVDGLPGLREWLATL